MTTPPDAAAPRGARAVGERFTEADRSAMRSALAMAGRGLGQTWPNPPVGCAVFDASGRLLARGRTQPGGRPHAEAAALATARAEGMGERLKGGSAFVTLEPCAHHGRTPPCALALSEAGLARVVFCIEDPDPRVAGRGAAMMAQAGLRVDVGLMAEEATAQLGGYLLRQTTGRPRLTLKLAATLDGRIATRSGESRWITGPAARARVHLLRARSDAILIGAGTARADDPMLDIRLAGLEDRKPVRVVADPSLSLSPESRLARSASDQPLWLLGAPDASAERRKALEAQGATVLASTRAPAGGLAPGAALAALGDQGLSEVLCEGGGALAAALLSAGLVDRLIWVSAGAAIGAEGAPALGPLGLDRLADARRFERVSTEFLGQDVWTEWRPAAPRSDHP